MSCLTASNQILSDEKLLHISQALKGFAPLAKNFHKYKDEWSDAEFDKRISKTYEIVKPSQVYRNVVCHQDLWANNMCVHEMGLL